MAVGDERWLVSSWWIDTANESEWKIEVSVYNDFFFFVWNFYANLTIAMLTIAVRWSFVQKDIDSIHENKEAVDA